MEGGAIDSAKLEHLAVRQSPGTAETCVAYFFGLRVHFLSNSTDARRSFPSASKVFGLCAAWARMFLTA